MDITARNVLINGMLKFSTAITFSTNESPLEVLNQAIKHDPRITYYLHWFEIRGFLKQYELRAQYIHKDTPINIIKVITSEDDCLRAMCRSVSDYQKKLIVVVDEKVNLSRITEVFQVKYTTFYSNLTSISTMGYHSMDTFTVYEFGFQYRIGQVKLNMMESEVDAEVERLARLLFTDDMPTEAKIYMAHNYLASTVKYVNDRKNNLDTSYTQSAYGALIKHQCVCQGYAEAFKRIMDHVGIDCDIVSGQIIGSTEYHAWNIVATGNGRNYAHIDVTWDAAEGKPSYIYFCKGDSYFIGKRTWNRELNHACSAQFAVLSVARKYAYINRSKLIAKGIDPKVIDC